MGALIGGIITVIISIYLWVVWPGQAIVIQGILPIILLGAGLLAVIAGITSIKDSIEAKKLEQESQQQSSSSEQK